VPKSRILAVAGTIATTTALVFLGCASGSAETSAKSDEVGAFPMPGVQSASPRTQISLRGKSIDDLGTVTVTGSRSGKHNGTLKAHSDGNGASFVLNKPLAGGETVTVATDLNIPGAKDGDYTFKTTVRPKTGLQSDMSGVTPKLLKELTGQKGTPPSNGVQQFKSRPDLRPPVIQIRKNAQGTAPGYIFIAPKKVFGAKTRPELQNGPFIIKNAGEPVWFAENNKGNVTDFRVQQYDGKPVLTWWQGRSVLGTGEGVVQMVDTSFKPIKTIKGGNGYALDFHDTTITPQNTMLGIIYNPVARSLREFGGARNGKVVDAVIQEIDIKTGLVMSEWHSLGTIALREGKGAVPKGKAPLYDYVHPNSATLTPDGNILVSGRETWAGYKIDRKTGKLLARIGGKKSDYKMTGTSEFAWQHDIQQLSDDTLQIFDNEAAPKVRDQSRGLLLKIDEDKKTLSVKKEFKHKPDPLLAGTQGNIQALPNGNFFIGWGSQGYFSEFSADGKMLFDGRVARGQDTYRAYRLPFAGVPSSRPAVAADNKGRRVYASWNGATEVASWRVLTGDSASSVKEASTGKRTGFETTLTVPSGGRYVAVEALDKDGAVLGRSKTVKAKG
jgi:hypothetical protein